MFYKALGFAVWKLGVAYVRRNYGGQIRVAIVVAIVSVLAAGYLAARYGESS
jgi:hypothetical protein